MNGPSSRATFFTINKTMTININAQILPSLLHTFVPVLVRRICLYSRHFKFRLVDYSLFSWSLSLMTAVILTKQNTCWITFWAKTLKGKKKCISCVAYFLVIQPNLCSIVAICKKTKIKIKVHFSSMLQLFKKITHSFITLGKSHWSL